MAEGIIMVNERTTLRLLSPSLLCFRGRLTRLVSRSEPLAGVRARRESHTHDARACNSCAGMFRSPEFLETYRSFRYNYIVSSMVQSIMNIEWHILNV